MKKKIIIAIVMILVIAGGIFVFSKWEKESDVEKIECKANGNINIVLSLEDEISENTAWCGTFNLIWNDLKNDLAKQDIVFTPQIEVVKNLNKGTFNTSHLSEDSYYKVYGRPTLELKAEIEKAIREKFNETSDILDDFEWDDRNSEDYFLYSMLKKEFEFPKVFSELEDGKFGAYENVKYFGIDGSTDKQVRNQVEVLYYHSKDDFAIQLLTKENDEVILAKGRKEKTFGNMYEAIMKQSEDYEGDASFGENDTLKIPNISFDLKEEFKDLENKPFSFSNGKEYEIETALQTIQFDLDKKGGKIKSEAGMMVREMMIMIAEEPREFLIDDTFTIFLIEENRDLPYFAAKISDITAVQKKAEKSANSEIAEPEENRKSAENFELRFLEKRYESQSKIRPILEKTETEKHDYNIYSYFGDVNILINGKEMPLREALLEDKITMDEIIAKANQDLDAEKIKGDMYKDGGSMIYQYEEYTIIKVHNLDGNRDVYIGVPEMDLNDLNR